MRVSGSLCDGDNGFSSYAVTATSLLKAARATSIYR
jgi:hypothetical protein